MANHEAQNNPATTAPFESPDGIPRRSPVNWRSLLLGVIGVLFLAGLTPYNTFVLQNSDLIGSFLPTGLLMFLFILILLVNGPLWRWRPRWALSSGEIAVVIGMMLAASALPAGGLMRYLPGNLAGFHDHASTNEEIRQLFVKLSLPNWIFPDFTSQDPAERGREPVIRDFMTRTSLDDPSAVHRFHAVPWGAWARPAMAWGLFIGATFSAVLCMVILFRRQWVENERLPFPIATVYLSLIETPPPGRFLNVLFRSRGFWIGFGCVFFLHAMGGLSAYFPKEIPAIPISFDLRGLFTEPPLRSVEQAMQKQTIYFTMIGMTFFIQAKVAFSMWSIFLIVQLVRMQMGVYQQDLTANMERDQFFGAMIPYALAMLWVARHHLAMVGRQMFRGRRADEPEERYLSYPLAGWGLLLSMAVMAGWLWIAGASMAGAILLVMSLLLIFTVATRLVAETGMLYLFLTPLPHRPWALLSQPFVGIRTTLRSYFYSVFVGGILAHDMRQSLTVYAGHALRVADDAAYAEPRQRQRPRSFVLAMAGALVLAYAVSWAAWLYVEYAYASSVDKAQVTPINEWGVRDMPRWWGIEMTRQYDQPANVREAHSAPLHVGIGAAIATTLSALRLRFTNWPLHPAGFLLVYTIGLRYTWFSVFLGWLAKVVLLKFGGSKAYGSARPFFLGLILGEAMAVALWLVVALILSSLDYRYEVIRILLT